ncbi:ABC transporter ATP-binding protein [Parvularcula lutaonensis]|uniref:ABC transporter ATP-binding protein n=1 Tax=Parvularcula lutaonensis TaxID=491923 RepID=A0ABV7MFP2_9PROT|nr:ABC transporter ATP-binding protein [Parvularcula lutaonensis]GGY53981.1 capsule polysaccharide export ATP-binding protein CtrD [Parvularcula lutaonensis]
MDKKYIRVQNVSKTYKTKAGWNPVLKEVSLEITPDDRLGILGRNGAGKSTLLRMIGGSETPDSGTVERSMTVSWPVGFNGHLQPGMSGRANTKFCARVYGADVDGVVDFVREFSELGTYLEEPVKSYSSGMKARLGFALSMAIEFDCLLIDEVTAVGDAAFRKKCNDALETLSENRAFVLVNHGLHEIDRLCNKVIVLGVEDRPVISTKVHKSIKAYQRALTEGVWERPQ